MSRSAQILPTHTPQLFEAATIKAAELLRQGEAIALPTETVYGLAANAFNEEAVARIFQIKGRPGNNPIIVHVCDLEMARQCVRNWSPLADKLAASFWPGPLTIVLHKSESIPLNVTAGGQTVGIRWPAHPLFRAVVRECGFPLAAPSANLSNRVSPTTARHVWQQLGGAIPLIVDGGPCNVGVESTVLDLSAGVPRVLRPGMIHDEALVSVVGELQTGGAGTGNVLKSPGLLLKHYSPKARLVLHTWATEEDLLDFVRSHRVKEADTHVMAYSRIPSGSSFGRISVIPHDPEAYARALYSELHCSDEHGAGLIVVETPPDSPEWRAITDRLRRASAG